MSDKIMVEVLRSHRFNGRYTAVSVAGFRHGPDAGPWEVVASWPLSEEAKMRIAAEASPTSSALSRPEQFVEEGED